MLISLKTKTSVSSRDKVWARLMSNDTSVNLNYLEVKFGSVAYMQKGFVTYQLNQSPLLSSEK